MIYRTISRVAPYLNNESVRSSIIHLSMSNFDYCPLIWMYHGKTSNNQVDRVQKRVLRILYNDFNMQFELLLERKRKEKELQIKNLKIILKIKNFIYADIL